MIKRAVALFLCAVMLISASGCASLLEDDYSSSSAHQTAAPAGEEDSKESLDVGSYDELVSSLQQLVAEYKDGGTFRFVDYEGDVEEDVAKACMEVSNDTPLGAYSVYYMTNTVNMIVSYYEAEISITYKKTKEETQSIIEVSAIEDAKARIKNMMDNDKSQLVVSTSLADLTPDAVSSYVKFLYYNNPTRSVIMPTVDVNYYPSDAAASANRIVEISLEYPYSKNTLDKMENLMNAAADKIVESQKNNGDGAALLNITQMLADTITVNKMEELGDQSNQSIPYTAYGALVEHKATSEGFALAFKLLCDKLEIGCTVVGGTLDGSNHFWNIVSYGGEYYHIDVSRCKEDGIVNVFFRTDEQMSQRYAWDTANNYQCSGLVTYYDISGVDPGEAQTSGN